MRSPARALIAAVLAGEALVVCFAGLVAKDLGPVRPGTALAASGVLAVAFLVVAGFADRRWARPAGWALQAVVLAGGVLMPVMFAVGAMFVALWAYALVSIRRIERARAASPGPASG